MNLRPTLAPQSPAADAPAAPAPNAAYRAKAEQAAEQFEGFMIAQMLQQMRQSMRELASDDSPFKNRVNDDMLALADRSVADTLAGQRAFGIADALLRQLLPPAVADLAKAPLSFSRGPSPILDEARQRAPQTQIPLP